MRIDNYKRLNIEDYSPQERPLMEKLALTLNGGVDTLYIALRNRLTFGDNFDATQKVFNVKVDSNGIPIGTASFKLNTINGVVPKAGGSQVTLARNLTNSNIYPTGSPFLNFSQNGDVVTITHVAGLPSNNVFELTVTVFHQ